MRKIGSVQSTHVYPVKSLAGESLQEITVEKTGPKSDRFFMIVDEAGVFITQRLHPALSTLTCKELGEGVFEISSALDKVTFQFQSQDQPSRTAKIWQDQVSVFDASLEASQFLSAFLGINCSLVTTATTTPRNKIHKDTNTPYVTGFPDAAPFLIANSLSLNSLKSELEPRVTMHHFRPNLVVQLEEPWQELQLERLQISDIEFPVLYPCTRCKMINNNPLKGELELDLLRQMFENSKPDPVTFGLRAIHQNEGTIKVGDSVYARER